jgi:hypothetical protein
VERFAPEAGAGVYIDEIATAMAFEGGTHVIGDII